MKKIKLTTWRGMACVVLFTILPMTGFAQKTAFIDRDSVLSVTPGYIEKVTAFQQERNKYVQEIQAEKNQLDEMAQKLLSKYTPQENETLGQIKQRMTPADTLQLQIITDENRLMEKKSKTYEDMLSLTFKKEVQPILDQVNRIIEKYADDNKIDVVYSLREISPAVVYYSKNKNITATIIERVKKIRVE